MVSPAMVRKTLVPWSKLWPSTPCTVSCCLLSVVVCLLFGFVDAARIACWLGHWTHDRQVASSNPSRNGGIIFFSRVNFFVLALIWCPFHPRVTTVAHKRPWSFCQKCRWQVTPKHTYTFDPTKLELADYAAVQA